jgi:predicted trehalose synthase
VDVHFIRATTPEGTAVTYQVPITCRPEPEPGLEHALIGEVEQDGGSRRWVYDGPHDPAYLQALLRLLAEQGEAWSGGGAVFGRARAVRPPGGWAPDPSAPSQVLKGEQSNTSVIVHGERPMIIKLFRVLAAGDNPDVVIQTALARAGSTRVPVPAGWVEGWWPVPDGGTPVRGHLAYACEFLAGSEDAWRVATRAVSTGASFAAQAHELGATTAAVHLGLARALPTRAADPRVLGALADGLLARVDWAVDAVPELRPFTDAARARVDAVRTVRGTPDLQQVHGDYHLGQVLHAGRRGWIVLDFEGEPLRPLSERLAPDLALRDVAGMLRSFDYAARHATLGSDDEIATRAAQGWAQECREAFLDGYGAGIGRDPRADEALLGALELDKALYEAVYETRNRPDWAAIPMAAVRRLLA